MTHLQKQARDFGIAIACARNNVSLENFEFIKAASDELEDTTHPQYGAFSRTVSALAADLYKKAGQELSTECQLFEELSKAAAWHPELDRFIDPVLITLGLAQAEEMLNERRIVKSAGALALLPLAMQADAPVRAGLSGLMTLAAAGGAGVGALTYGLQRHANGDDDDIEAMKAKAKHYRQLTNEISQRLQQNNAVNIA